MILQYYIVKDALEKAADELILPAVVHIFTEIFPVMEIESAAVKQSIITI